MPTLTRGLFVILLVATGVITSGGAFVVGSRYGAEKAIAELRSISFGSREGNLDRLLKLDTTIASGDADLARRKLGALAWAEYSSLEDDAAGVVLEPTKPMLDAITSVRGLVEEFCQSGAAALHKSAEGNICSELAVRRSNKSLERKREE